MFNAPMAQWIRRLTSNQKIEGSSPSRGFYSRVAQGKRVRLITSRPKDRNLPLLIFDTMAEWSKAVDSRSTLSGGAGSNPAGVILDP